MIEKNEVIEGTSLQGLITSELKSLIQQVDFDSKQKSVLKKYLTQVQKAFQKSPTVGLNKVLISRNREQLFAQYSDAREIFERLSAYSNRQSGIFFASLFNKFESYAKGNNVPLRGRMPNLILGNLLEVNIDESKRTVKVGIIFLRTLEWDKIQSLVEHELARIWKREFDPIMYHDLLLKFHSDILKVKPNPIGWVRLEDVYQSLKTYMMNKNPNWKAGGRLSAYYKDEFSADLSKLWEAQINGKVNPPILEFSAIRNPRLSYKIVLPDKQMLLYGHLRPTKGGNQ